MKLDGTLTQKAFAFYEAHSGKRVLSAKQRQFYDNIHGAVMMMFMVAAAALVTLAPDLAQAQTAATTLTPIEEVVESIIGIMTGPIATGIGIIAVAALGYTFLTGMVEFRRAMFIFIGLAVVFGAPQIVRLIRGSTTSTGPGSIGG